MRPICDNATSKEEPRACRIVWTWFDFNSWRTRYILAKISHFASFRERPEGDDVLAHFKATWIQSLQKLSVVQGKNFKKSHRFPYLAYDHGDAGGGDDGDDDDVYAASLSRTPYSRSLGRSCASLVRQLLYQRSLVASCYPDTSGTHLGSSWNV